MDPVLGLSIKESFIILLFIIYYFILLFYYFQYSCRERHKEELHIVQLTKDKEQVLKKTGNTMISSFIGIVTPVLIKLTTSFQKLLFVMRIYFTKI